jgi:hypothetical protein
MNTSIGFTWAVKITAFIAVAVFSFPDDLTQIRLADFKLKAAFSGQEVVLSALGVPIKPF